VSNSTAVVTMVYNEDLFLPLWSTYYGRHFGHDHCYVVDHGSSDGTTDRENCPSNVVKIPRSPKHNQKRTRFLSDFCSSLLEWYDTVIYTDVDEFLVPDPNDYKDFADFCANRKHATVNAIGFNVVHRPDVEPNIDPSRPILPQRQYVRFEFAMCKPLVTSEAIKWIPGFHHSDRPMAFDGLFLFHLHNFDLASGLLRLARTRAMEWGDAAPDHHQRWDDQRHEAMIRAIGRCPKIDDATFLSDDPNVQPHLATALSFVAEHPKDASIFYTKVGRVDQLLHLPQRFLTAF
jgi:hypothetical protein